MKNDATLSLDDIASAVGDSKNPVWNRLKLLKQEGMIRREVGIVDPDKIGLEARFCFGTTNEHDGNWQARFLSALKDLAEIIEAYWLAGEIDYLLKVQVAHPKAYDRFCESLISEVKVFTVAALVSMEELKYTTVLPH